MRRGNIGVIVLLIGAGCGRDPLVTPDADAPPDLASLPPGPDLGVDPACRTVEIHFAPGTPDLQIAVWIEDAAGRFVDTLYLTRLTAQFGLGNRPGAALLNTDFKWPYGRREMVLPVWAHRRNHHYPLLVMGGICGNSPDSLCPDGSPCAGDCDDTTIVYHYRVSSFEPFYCSPNGASQLDAMSCASRGTFSKGAFATDGRFSLYPPRADVQQSKIGDSPDVAQLATLNDVSAISAATPPKSIPVDPPPTWYAQAAPDGDYVAWIELSQESDFNMFHNHPNQPDSTPAWAFLGHPFLGQPSIVYSIPFHLGPDGATAVATSYAGYGAWDGADGDLRPPDGTITDEPGSGAGRLLDIVDSDGSYRVKVVAGACPR